MNVENVHLSVGQLKERLDKIYCDNVSAEFSYITSEEEREWIAERYEAIFESRLENQERKEIAELMLKA